MSAAPLDGVRWPDIAVRDIACRCCGEIVIDPVALDALQRLQRALGAPLTITSGHRCALHNARAAGFTGFGQTFLHLDTRARPAHWFYGQRSKQQWISVLSSTAV